MSPLSHIVRQAYLKKYERELKKFFLEFGLETQDNVESMRHIELGKIGSDFGIKIKDKDIFISDIMNAVEDMEDVPQEVKEYYSEITHEEWQASTRVSTLILVLFEKILKEEFVKRVRKEMESLNEEPISSNISYEPFSLDFWMNNV